MTQKRIIDEKFNPWKSLKQRIQNSTALLSKRDNCKLIWSTKETWLLMRRTLDIIFNPSVFWKMIIAMIIELYICSGISGIPSKAYFSYFTGLSFTIYFVNFSLLVWIYTVQKWNLNQEDARQRGVGLHDRNNKVFIIYKSWAFFARTHVTPGTQF